MSRTPILAGMLLATGAILAATIASPRTRVIWNASASLPIGLYAVQHIDRPNIGDLVLARTPDDWTREFDTRGYLPAGVPLLKRVAAASGSTVCRNETRITIDGAFVATAQRHDRYGRPLPAWQGCHRLGADEVFLLIAEHSASLDGRYLGPTPMSSIIGRAEPLWTLKEP